MAHFAEINENNQVVRVLVTDNNDPAGDEGHQWLVDNFGGTWIKTSFNTDKGIHLNGGVPLRKNYAGIGYTYDSSKDAFIPPKPYNSWILNDNSCIWESPVELPNDGKNYKWNENSVSWEEIPDPSI